MKISEFIRLLPLLPLDAEGALSAKAIGQKFYGQGADAALQSAQTRAIQRYLLELSEQMDADIAPVQKVHGNPPRYFLRQGKLVEWFMSDQIALNLLLARQALSAVNSGNLLGELELKKAADHLVQHTPEAQRIWHRLRLARSGIGRLPPPLDSTILRTLLQAVMQERQVRLVYQAGGTRPYDPDVTIQGLVMKDDTLYLLATTGLSDTPRHMAVHRISAAEILPQPAQVQPGFDLDQYIEKQYQFSHLIHPHDPPIQLQLRVHKDWVLHFEERRLTPDQTIQPDPERSDWYRVTAHIPELHTLVAFLQSMGAGLEVLGPENVRQQMATQAKQVADFYR